MKTLPSFISAAVLLIPAWLHGEEDYLKDIKPLLKARCYACHGALKQKSGLRLDTVAAMRKGGEDGNILGPDKASLIERVTNTDEHERMPPEGAPLSSAEIAKLRAWISAGAKSPLDEQPEPDPRLHWAYRKPKSAQATMDALLADRLNAKGFKRQADAPPEVWLRRVYLDLIGIPPTAEQIRAFEVLAKSNAATAREQTVDKLLNFPQYGERWARHFMDIWRYCDWYGLDQQLRNSQKHLWHWRDWIVEALNKDKGYDRMIVEMLAADEESPTDRDALRATGFLCRNYYLFNRTTWLDDVIEHTNRAFLGVTMQCAKCHDHKYDPITQTDYYQMRAIFEPYHVRLDAWPGETDFEKNGLARAFDLHLDRVTYRHVRGDEKNEDKSQVIKAGVPAVLAFDEFKPVPVKLPLAAIAPGAQQFVLDDQLSLAERGIAQAKEAHDKARKALDDARQKGTATRTAAAESVALISDLGLKAAQAKATMLRREFEADTAVAENLVTNPDGFGLSTISTAAAAREVEYQIAQAELELAQLKASISLPPKKADVDKLKKSEDAVAAAKKRIANPGAKYNSLRGSLKAQNGPEEKNNAEVQAYPTTSTGRRLAFARWIVDARNPLTARVLVNHVWLRHFGASLVPDVTDFGRRCPPPLHQDVLDTLAVDFMEHGWSIKRLHKQMVLSQLYCASSSNAGADAATLSADAENAFYWRMNPRRLESQAVRDCVLSIAGKLDLTMGGPSIDPSAEASPRRSLYYVQSAHAEQRFLGTLDNSNVLECYRRQESIVPQQALALANSKLTRECADAYAARTAGLNEKEFIDDSFLTVLGRLPNAEEAQVSSQSLATFAGLKTPKPDSQRTRALFVQALMNHNDFLTIR